MKFSSLSTVRIMKFFETITLIRGAFRLFIMYKLWVHILAIGSISLVYSLYLSTDRAYISGICLIIFSGLLAILVDRPKHEPSILYLSFNDGSDMRINKEVQTLASISKVDFLGIGEDKSLCFISKKPINRLYWIQGCRQSLRPRLHYFATAIKLLSTKRYHSVHVINEPQLIILWPFLLLQKHVVLDIFDSLFLRRNHPGNQWRLAKRAVYVPADNYLVTDNNRLDLLPDFMKNKTFVLPNYPNRRNKSHYSESKIAEPGITIMYFGWLGAKRGTETILAILDTGLPVKVIMAGWVADDLSKNLAKHQSVSWKGTMAQAEALELASTVDYILCVYAPINQNNINASPNKVYDAIQLQVPVIINGEIMLSDFVKSNQVGFVLPEYNAKNWNVLVKDLIRLKGTYRFPDELIQAYTWENISDELLKVHRL